MAGMKRWLPILPLLLTGCVSALPEPSSVLPVVPDAPANAVAAEASAEPRVAEAAPAVPGATPAVKTRRVNAPAAPKPSVPSDIDKQPIEELVIRPASLTGYWKLTAARTIDVDIGLFSGIHIRYGGENRDRNICWLQQTGKSLSALCVSGTVLKSAEGSVGEDDVTMRWWSGAATVIFSGKFTDAERVSGGFSGGVVGLSVTGDVPATLTKLDLPPEPPPSDRPSAALIKAVWEDVRQGHLTDGRYEGSAVKRVNQGMPKEIAGETPQDLAYLGQITVRWRKEQRETLQDVYQVRTGAGRRLCRVAANEQGQVVDFNCVALSSP